MSEEKSGRGGARPGAGRKPSAPKAEPEEKSSPPTKQEWEMLDYFAATAAYAVSDMMAAKMGAAWPNGESWRERRATSTQQLVRKYGAAAAKHSVELNFVAAWTLPLLMARLPQKVSVSLANVKPPAPVPKPPMPEPAQKAPEWTEAAPVNGKTHQGSIAAQAAQETPDGPE